MDAFFVPVTLAIILFLVVAWAARPADGPRRTKRSDDGGGDVDIWIDGGDSHQNGHSHTHSHDPAAHVGHDSGGDAGGHSGFDGGGHGGFDGGGHF